MLSKVSVPGSGTAAPDAVVNATSRREEQVPLACMDQVAPPLLVWTIVHPEPTAQASVASGEATPQRWPVIGSGSVWAVQVAPPALVWTVVRLDPTAHPCM